MDHRMKIKAYINGEQVAAFGDETVARMFTIAFSKRCPTKTIELVGKSGMIGQYTAGVSSAEFKPHHDSCFLIAA